MQLRIHQIYLDFGGGRDSATLPPKYRASCARWQQLNPDWEYTLWDDAMATRLLEADYPQFLDAYKRLPVPVQRVDILRLLVLHRYGGVYFDCDVMPLRPLDADDLLAPSAVTLVRSCNWPSDFAVETLVNFAMLARDPGHPFWLAACAEMLQAAHAPFWRTVRRLWGVKPYVVCTTGPARLSLIHARRGLTDARHRRDFRVLDAETFCPVAVPPHHHHFKSLLRPEAAPAGVRASAPERLAALYPRSYAAHLWDGGWFD